MAATIYVNDLYVESRFAARDGGDHPRPADVDDRRVRAQRAARRRRACSGPADRPGPRVALDGVRTASASLGARGTAKREHVMQQLGLGRVPCRAVRVACGVVVGAPARGAAHDTAFANDGHADCDSLPAQGAPRPPRPPPKRTAATPTAAAPSGPPATPTTAPTPGATPTGTPGPVVTGPASLDAPATVAADTLFDVNWTGPNALGDYVTLVAKATRSGPTSRISTLPSARPATWSRQRRRATTSCGTSTAPITSIAVPSPDRSDTAFVGTPDRSRHRRRRHALHVRAGRGPTRQATTSRSCPPVPRHGPTRAGPTRPNGSPAIARCAAGGRQHHELAYVAATGR